MVDKIARAHLRFGRITVRRDDVGRCRGRQPDERLDQAQPEPTVAAGNEDAVHRSFDAG